MVTLERLGTGARVPHPSNDSHTPHVALKQKLQGATLSLGKEGVSHNQNDLQRCDLGKFLNLSGSCSFICQWGHLCYLSQNCYEGSNEFTDVCLKLCLVHSAKLLLLLLQLLLMMMID